jgi:glutamate-1-semialdehyde aminotransferase
MSMATGTAVLSHLRQNPDAYRYVREQSQRLTNQLNRLFAANNLDAQMQHVDSILSLRLRPRDVVRTARDASLDPALSEASDAFHLKMFDRGVMLAGPSQFFLSIAHTEQDVDMVMAAFGDVLRELRDEGIMPGKVSA